MAESMKLSIEFLVKTPRSGERRYHMMQLIMNELLDRISGEFLFEFLAWFASGLCGPIKNWNGPARSFEAPRTRCVCVLPRRWSKRVDKR